jgi:hypothetical protein
VRAFERKSRLFAGLQEGSAPILPEYHSARDDLSVIRKAPSKSWRKLDILQTKDNLTDQGGSSMVSDWSSVIRGLLAEST